VSDGATFTLTATPKGAQSGDKCGDFILYNTGVKKVSASGKGDECGWK
jgi:type IV pilus assembly protein PilE